MAPAPATGTGYMLDNVWHDARRRLSLLEGCWTPGPSAG
jgi:hypothetical protein